MKTLWLAAGLGLALAQGANAADMETRQVRVSLKGLDLASADGQAIAHQRIESAAKDACGRGDVRDMAAAADYAKCQWAALHAASAQVNALVAAAETRMRVAVK